MTRAQRLRKASEGNATPISNAIIVLAIIGSLTYLVTIGKVNGDAYISIAAGIIGALLVRQGVHVGSQATSDPPAGE